MLISGRETMDNGDNNGKNSDLLKLLKVDAWMATDWNANTRAKNKISEPNNSVTFLTPLVLLNIVVKHWLLL